MQVAQHVDRRHRQRAPEMGLHLHLVPLLDDRESLRADRVESHHGEALADLLGDDLESDVDGLALAPFRPPDDTESLADQPVARGERAGRGDRARTRR